jgi:outer membrane protein
MKKNLIRVFTSVAFIVATSGALRAETLKQALAATYVNNPQIAAALLSVKASAEDIAIRKAGKLPSINATADFSSSWMSSGGISTDSSSGSIGLSYRQTLFDNLKTDAQIEQARAYTEVASNALRSAIQNTLLSAAKSYLDVVRETNFVKLRAENVAFYQAQVRSAKDRLKIGTGTRTAVSQAEARLAQGVASYRSAVNNLKTAQASYQRWVGHKPKNLSLSYDFRNILPRSMDEAQNLADRNHPAILSAKAQLRAAQSASDAAKAAFGPTLSLIGNIGSSTNYSSGSTTASGSVKLTLSIPIYQGGALGASVRKANINQIKSEIDVLNARDQVRESVVSSWSGLQTAKSQINAASSSIKSSKQVLNGVIEEQKVGQRTTLDVLNARAELTAVRESEISAQTSKYFASFSLLSASGRLTARDLGLNVKVQTGSGYIKKVEDVWQDLRSLSN